MLPPRSSHPVFSSAGCEKPTLSSLGSHLEQYTYITKAGAQIRLHLLLIIVPTAPPRKNATISGSVPREDWVQRSLTAGPVTRYSD
jgi:hypothetical protein